MIDWKEVLGNLYHQRKTLASTLALFNTYEDRISDSGGWMFDLEDRFRYNRLRHEIQLEMDSITRRMSHILKQWEDHDEKISVLLEIIENG